jgi:hypothetical protein
MKFPAANGSKTGASFQSTVDGVFVGGISGARIERGLMPARVQDGALMCEDLLGAVPVMRVPIDDGDPAGPVQAQSRSCANRHVVEDAETHPSCAPRVVPRGPYRAKRAVPRSGHDLRDCQGHGARCQQRCPEGAGPHVGTTLGI